MAQLYFDRREIVARIVYFGAPGAGSNTNVRRLYGLIAVRERSALHHFGPDEAQEQSCFFEYVPPGGGTIPGVNLRLRVYSLPGGVRQDAHRREVLRHVDAIIFVADARASRSTGNASAAEELEAYLSEQGVDPRKIPVVIQVNHTDAMDARHPAEIEGWAGGLPFVNAVARASAGVVETHDALMARLNEAVKTAWDGGGQSVTLASATKSAPESDQEVVARHLMHLRAPAAQPMATLPPGEFENALLEHYRALTTTLRYEVLFQPREVLSARLVQLLGATLEGDRITLDLVLERLSGSGPQRLLLTLQPTPVDLRRTPGARTAPPPPLVPPLPESAATLGPTDDDPSSAWYGTVGIAAGMFTGLLVGYLLWA